MQLTAETEGLAAFRPDGARARLIHERVVTRLAESVREIVGALDRAGAAPEGAEALADRLLAEGRFSPIVFCIYFDLFEAVRRDDVEAAAELVREMAARLDMPQTGFLTDWGQIDERARERYLGVLNADATTRVDFAVPSEAIARSAVDVARRALSALEAAAPEMADEIRSLLTQIVFVSGVEGSGMLFDGASSFYCWGALFLNADEHQTLIDMIDGLAHESAHSHLYGLSLGDPFVDNPVTERYHSPLRRDPRHLDGIFHATYVSARMHYAHSRLLEAGLLEEEELAAARGHMDGSIAAFWGGWRTFDAHARPTELGRDVMASAHRYMAGVSDGGA